MKGHGEQAFDRTARRGCDALHISPHRLALELQGGSCPPDMGLQAVERNPIDIGDPLHPGTQSLVLKGWRHDRQRDPPLPCHGSGRSDGRRRGDMVVEDRGRRDAFSSGEDRIRGKVDHHPEDR